MNQIVIAAATLLLQVALPTESVASRELNERIAYMKDHFGEMQFKPEGGFILRKGQPLPDLVWDEPEVASALLTFRGRSPSPGTSISTHGMKH